MIPPVFHNGRMIMKVQKGRKELEMGLYTTSSQVLVSKQKVRMSVRHFCSKWFLRRKTSMGLTPPPNNLERAIPNSLKRVSDQALWPNIWTTRSNRKFSVLQLIIINYATGLENLQMSKLVDHTSIRLLKKSILSVVSWAFENDFKERKFLDSNLKSLVHLRHQEP
jgi:hypothetical protein